MNCMYASFSGSFLPSEKGPSPYEMVSDSLPSAQKGFLYVEPVIEINCRIRDINICLS